MFDNFSDRIDVSLPTDAQGYRGRECPQCGSYFKIVFGTGLKGTTHCYCPYCGHDDDHSEFHTRAQIEYAKSVAINKFTRALIQDLKKLETPFSPRNSGFINIEIEVTGSPTSINYYWEHSLETHVTCSICTLKYAVYGVYAYCPDCRQRNAIQILDTSLDIVLKLLDLAKSSEEDITHTLIENALSSIVAAFDGYGREVCRANASKSSTPSQAATIRFQNLAGAQSNVNKHFGFDVAASLTTREWETANRCFQKRHLLAHNSGVIDDEYIKKANDPSAILGRKVKLTSDEIRQLVDIVRKLGIHIAIEIDKLP